MLGKTQPCGVDFGHTNGIQAASAAGRPEGRQKTAGDLGKVLRRATGGGATNLMWVAMVLGMFPR